MLLPLYALLSCGLNASVFCPLLISAANGSWCKPRPSMCVCPFRLCRPSAAYACFHLKQITQGSVYHHEIYISVFTAVILLRLIGFCCSYGWIWPIRSPKFSINQHFLLSRRNQRKCSFYDNRAKELCGFTAQAFPVCRNIILCLLNQRTRNIWSIFENTSSVKSVEWGMNVVWIFLRDAMIHRRLFLIIGSLLLSLELQRLIK